MSSSSSSSSGSGNLVYHDCDSSSSSSFSSSSSSFSSSSFSSSSSSFSSSSFSSSSSSSSNIYQRATLWYLEGASWYIADDFGGTRWYKTEFNNPNPSGLDSAIWETLPPGIGNPPVTTYNEIDDNITVEGAGNPVANGLYVRYGNYNEAPAYIKLESSSSSSSSSFSSSSSSFSSSSFSSSSSSSSSSSFSYSSSSSSSCQSGNVLVSGAGTSNVNGLYTYAGTYNGENYYTYNDGVTTWYLFFDFFWYMGWVIDNRLGGDPFVQPYYYYSYTFDFPPNPPWSYTWYVDFGSSPAPTVSEYVCPSSSSSSSSFSSSSSSFSSSSSSSSFSSSSSSFSSSSFSSSSSSSFSSSSSSFSSSSSSYVLFYESMITGNRHYNVNISDEIIISRDYKRSYNENQIRNKGYIRNFWNSLNNINRKIYMKDESEINFSRNIFSKKYSQVESYRYIFAINDSELNMERFIDRTWFEQFSLYERYYNGFINSKQIFDRKVENFLEQPFNASRNIEFPTVSVLISQRNYNTLKLGILNSEREIRTCLYSYNDMKRRYYAYMEAGSGDNTGLISRHYFTPYGASVYVDGIYKGFINIEDGETELDNIIIPDGQHTITIEMSKWFWPNCRDTKNIVVNIVGGELEIIDIIPDVVSLNYVLSSQRTQLIWNIAWSDTYGEPNIDGYGVWFGSTSPVDISGTPDVSVAYNNYVAEYSTIYTTLSAHYARVAGYKNSNRGFSKEVYIPYVSSLPDSPLNQKLVEIN